MAIIHWLVFACMRSTSAILIGLVLIHIYLFRKHGSCERTPTQRFYFWPTRFSRCHCLFGNSLGCRWIDPLFQGALGTTRSSQWFPPGRISFFFNCSNMCLLSEAVIPLFCIMDILQPFIGALAGHQWISDLGGHWLRTVALTLLAFGRSGNLVMLLHLKKPIGIRPCAVDRDHILAGAVICWGRSTNRENLFAAHCASLSL